jgi:hypothetical protein
MAGNLLACQPSEGTSALSLGNSVGTDKAGLPARQLPETASGPAPSPTELSLQPKKLQDLPLWQMALILLLLLLRSWPRLTKSGSVTEQVRPLSESSRLALPVSLQFCLGSADDG